MPAPKGNQYALGNKGGRPFKFKSLEELQEKIDDYFTITSAEDITITGLALHLDTSRQTLMNYEKEKGYEEYFDSIKIAKTRVEHEYEKDLRKKGTAGSIFGLKNFKWRDKFELESKAEIEIKDVTGMRIL